MVLAWRGEICAFPVLKEASCIPRAFWRKISWG
jgi:hypothetical protein